jgi:hypothetical protein
MSDTMLLGIPTNAAKTMGKGRGAVELERRVE